MTNTPLVLGQFGKFTLGAADAGSNPRSATFNVKSNNYAVAYVLVNGNQIFCVSKTVGVATITITGSSADGTPLPSVDMQFTITATAPDPQATTFTESGVTVGAIDITMNDPGVDNVSGSL
jgi:hypothetical protein